MDSKEKIKSQSIEDLKSELERRETIQKLKELSPSFFVRTWYIIKKNTAIWIPTVLLSIITIFSNYIAEGIQGALNKANVWSEEYVKMGADLAEYNFSVELVLEFFEKKSEGREFLITVVDDYNENVHGVRRNEYSNLALIHQNMGVDMADDYEDLLIEVRAIDSLFRELNPVYFLMLNSGDGELIAYTPEMMDEIDKRTSNLRTAQNSLAKHTKEFLTALE